MNATQAAQEGSPEAPATTYTRELEQARQRVAERRAELEAAEREAERLEALAQVEHRREEQQAEIRLLEAQARELERGPIAQLRGRKAAALLASRGAERRVAKIARSLEHQRESLTLTEDRTRLARKDGDPGELASLTRHRSELAAVISELERALAEAQQEAFGHRQRLEAIQPQLGGYVERTPAYEVQRLRGRAALLRSLDGEDEAVKRRREERDALARGEARTAQVAAEAAQRRAVARTAERESRIAAWRTGQAWLPGARR